MNSNTNFQNNFFQELSSNILKQLKYNPRYLYNIILPIIYIRCLTLTKKKLGIIIHYKEKLKLKRWLEDKTRYQALNILQETIFNYLKTYDEELKEHILKIVNLKKPYLIR